jgi:hypothetical protein
MLRAFVTPPLLKRFILFHLVTGPVYPLVEQVEPKALPYTGNYLAITVSLCHEIKYRARCSCLLDGFLNNCRTSQYLKRNPTVPQRAAFVNEFLPRQQNFFEKS